MKYDCIVNRKENVFFFIRYITSVMKYQINLLTETNTFNFIMIKCCILYKQFYYILCSYLDFHLVEGLAVVDSHDATDHLRHDDHVTQVGLHTLDNNKSGMLVQLSYCQYYI